MEEKGVWKTISGRRVFIKEGQSLTDAMKESGKFNKKERKAIKEKEETEKEWEMLKNKYDGKYKNTTESERKKALYDLEQAENSSTLSYEERLEKREERKYLKKRAQREYDDKAGERAEVREKKMLQEELSEKNRVSKMSQDQIQDLKRGNLNPMEQKSWDKEVDSLIKSYETKELYINAYHIEEDIWTNKILNRREQDIESLHINKMINDKEYELMINNHQDYVDEIQQKLHTELSVRGYEYEQLPNGKVVYSQRVRIQTGYNQMLDYLDRKKIKYEISRSTNAGIVPSIYIKDKDGDVIARIGNHANSNMNYLEKVFDNSDYLKWKTQIIDKIDLK